MESSENYKGEKIEGKRVNINEAGEYHPEKRPLLIKLVSILGRIRRLEKNFWTERRLERYNPILETINGELRSLGAEEINVSPNQIKFLSLGESLGGGVEPQSGEIFLNPDDPHYEHNLAHELLHYASVRRFKASDPMKQRRFGLSVTPKPFKAVGRRFFDPLNEAVIQKTAMYTLNKAFEGVRQKYAKYTLGKTPEFISFAYHDEIKLMERICHLFSKIDEQNRSPEEIFRLLQKITFTGDGLLEFGRLAKKAFGSNGFKKFAVSLIKATTKTHELSEKPGEINQLDQFLREAEERAATSL